MSVISPEREKGLQSLTEKEREVLRLLGELGVNKLVAAKMGLSAKSVEHQLKSIRAKLEVGTSVEAVSLYSAWRAGPDVETTAETEAVRRRVSPWVWAIGSLVVVTLALAGWKFWAAAPVNHEPKLPSLDEFNEKQLDGNWTAKYGQGSVSLTDHPGYLRYSLGGKTDPGDAKAFKLFRTFTGRRWTLEFQVEYHLPRGTGRQLYFRVWFGDAMAANTPSVVWYRCRDDGAVLPDEVGIDMMEGKFETKSPDKQFSKDGGIIRIVRQGNIVKVEGSEDGQPFRVLAVHPFVSRLPGRQTIQISGGSFGSAGGHADYDFIRHTSATNLLP